MKKFTSVISIVLLLLMGSVSFAGERDIPDLYAYNTIIQNIVIVE